MRGRRRDACRRRHVQCFERARGSHLGLPGRHRIRRSASELCVERKGRIGRDRQVAGGAGLVIAGREAVEAMQRAACVAQMHACTQRAQGRRVIVRAQAQLVDARFANLDLQRQAQGTRRRRRLARSRCRFFAAQQRDAIGVQRGEGQVQPAAVVAARSVERLPARRVEAQHAARTGQRDVDALRREVAEQRAARRDHLQLRRECHQPGAAAGAVQGPASRSATGAPARTTSEPKHVASHRQSRRLAGRDGTAPLAGSALATSLVGVSIRR